MFRQQNTTNCNCSLMPQEIFKAPVARVLLQSSEQIEGKKSKKSLRNQSSSRKRIFQQALSSMPPNNRDMNQIHSPPAGRTVSQNIHKFQLTKPLIFQQSKKISEQLQPAVSSPVYKSASQSAFKLKSKGFFEANKEIRDQMTTNKVYSQMRYVQARAISPILQTQHIPNMINSVRSIDVPVSSLREKEQIDQRYLMYSKHLEKLVNSSSLRTTMAASLTPTNMQDYIRYCFIKNQNETQQKKNQRKIENSIKENQQYKVSCLKKQKCLKQDAFHQKSPGEFLPTLPTSTGESTMDVSQKFVQMMNEKQEIQTVYADGQNSLQNCEDQFSRVIISCKKLMNNGSVLQQADKAKLFCFNDQQVDTQEDEAVTKLKIINDNAKTRKD